MLRIRVRHNGAVILTASDRIAAARLHTGTSHHFSASPSNAVSPERSNPPVSAHSESLRNAAIIFVQCKCVVVEDGGPNPSTCQCYASFLW
jgi:hypothetical protein